MPAIHSSLTNADFIKANDLAKEKGMELKEWVSAIIISEIHRIVLPPINTQESAETNKDTKQTPDGII